MKKLLKYLYFGLALLSTPKVLLASNDLVIQGSGSAGTLVIQAGSSGGGGGGSGTVTQVNTGSGIAGGGFTTSGTLSLKGGDTNYINNTGTLQAGSTFFVSSGTVAGNFSVVPPASGRIDIGNDGANEPSITFRPELTGDRINFHFYNANGVTEVALIRVGGTASGYNISLATGSAAIPVSRIHASDQNDGRKIAFNEGNGGFTTQLSSMTFVVGSTNPILSWTEARLILNNAGFSVTGATLGVNGVLWNWMGVDGSAGQAITTNGNKTLSFVSLLSESSATATYLSLSSASATYLLPSVAAATYLTQSSATATYLQLSSASATYLLPSVAAATYLTQSSATATYLQLSSATATYLLPSVAAATYLTQSSAPLTYLQIVSSNSFVQLRETLQVNSTFYVSSGTVQGNLIVRSSMTVLGLMKIPNSGTVNVTTQGEIAIDTDAITSSSGTLVFFSDQKWYVVATTGPVPQASGYVPKTTGNGGVSWQPDSAGGGSGTVTSITATGDLLGGVITTAGTISLASGSTKYINNTGTLQTGSTFYVSSGSVNGRIDVSTVVAWRDIFVGNAIRDAYNSNNIFLIFMGTSPVANYFAIQNSSTGANPVLIATGTDSNINLQLQVQGLGGVVIITSSTIQQSSMNGGMVFNSVNSSSTAGNFQIKGSTDSNLFVTDAINNTVSIGSATAFSLSKFWVTSADNQTTMVANINVAQANLTAADTFIDFRSSSGSEGSVAGTAVAGVIAFNTFTGSHFTLVQDKSTIRTFDLLCSVGDRIDKWPSSFEEEIEVGFGPIYNVYYKNVSDIPEGSLINLRTPLVIDTNFPRTQNLDLTADGLDFIGIPSDSDPRTGFPVLDRIGTQYTFQETERELVTRNPASIKSHLFKSKVCTSLQDKSAIGAFGGTDQYGRDMILSIGTGKLNIINKGRDLEIGDYLMSSDRPGNVEKQVDDLNHNYTIGRVTEPVLWVPGEIERIVNVIYMGG